MIPTIVVTIPLVGKSNTVVYSYLIDLDESDEEMPVILIVKPIAEPLAGLVIVPHIVY